MNLFRKVLQGGAAYLQHVTFIKAALASSEAQRPQVVEAYVQGLTEASIIGLRAILIMHANQANDSRVKQDIQLLLQEANVARGGKLQTTKPPEGTTNTTESADFDRDLKLVAHWTEDLKQEEQKIALVDHLITLDSDGYARFMKSVKEMKAKLLENMQQHKANEDQAWGPFFEDRIAYFQAKMQTGESDPKFMRVLREYEQSLENIKWVIETSNEFWALIQQRRAAAGH
jgi:hypothetical protein